MSDLAQQVIQAFQAGHGVLAQREASARADAELELQRERQRHEIEMALQTLELTRQAHEFMNAESTQKLAANSSDPRKSTGGGATDGGLDLGTAAPGPRPVVKAGGISFPLQFLQDIIQTKDTERAAQVAANIHQAGGEARARNEAADITVDPALAAAASAQGMNFTPGQVISPEALKVGGETFKEKEATRRANIAASAKNQTLGSGLPVLPGTSGLPPDQEARLLQLPLDVPKNLVVGLITGRGNPQGLGRGVQNVKLKDAARFVDPTWNENTFKIRQDALKSFTSGPDAANITAIDTADRHLDSLSKNAMALQNADLQLWNQIKNKGLTATGDPRVARFLADARAVENEMGKVFRSGSGVVTQEEIRAWHELYSTANSPQQLQAAISEGRNLIGGRVAALQGKADRALGSATVDVIPKRIADRYKDVSGGGHPDGIDAQGFLWKGGHRYKRGAKSWELAE